MIETLNKVLENTDTRELANIFKNYMEQQNIRKYDGRKKDNSNTYYIEGKYDKWDRVFCVYYQEDRKIDLEIILRKRGGKYLIINQGSKIIFESCVKYEENNNYLDRILFEDIYEKHKALFDELFSQ